MPIFFFVEQVVLQNFFGTQLVTAVYERDFGRDIAQVERFFGGRVTATNYGDVFAAVERTRHRLRMRKLRAP